MVLLVRETTEFRQNLQKRKLPESPSRLRELQGIPYRITDWLMQTTTTTVPAVTRRPLATQRYYHMLFHLTLASADGWSRLVHDTENRVRAFQYAGIRTVSAAGVTALQECSAHRQTEQDTFSFALPGVQRDLLGVLPLVHSELKGANGIADIYA
uniref:Nitroreductase domain-containing protein n=1 Tax=Steinernema glaseri TaxID=37863 RepID=A0A1I8A8R5_9BILA